MNKMRCSLQRSRGKNESHGLKSKQYLAATITFGKTTGIKTLWHISNIFKFAIQTWRITASYQKLKIFGHILLRSIQPHCPQSPPVAKVC
jgi:hypothetical protein